MVGETVITHSTTVTVVAQVDMQDPMEGFVMRKDLPGARLSLSDQCCEQEFQHDGQQCRLTVTADLPAGDHVIGFEYTSRDHGQGALWIRELHIQGARIGLPIYRGLYHRWETGEDLPTGRAGTPEQRWRYRI
jgi:hypothetical protein